MYEVSSSPQLQWGQQQYPFYIHVYYDKQKEASETLNMTELVESIKARFKKGYVPNAPYFRKFFKKKKDKQKTDKQDSLNRKIFTSSTCSLG